MVDYNVATRAQARGKVLPINSAPLERLTPFSLAAPIVRSSLLCHETGRDGSPRRPFLNTSVSEKQPYLADGTMELKNCSCVK
jgi:hypothetical protein